jgi:hypothetical protein
VIDEDSAHQLCSDSEKLRAVLPPCTALVHEPEVYLVDERSRLKGMADRFTAHCARCTSVELVVDYRQQLVCSGCVTVSPGNQELGYIGALMLRKWRQGYLLPGATIRPEGGGVNTSLVLSLFCALFRVTP